MPFLFLVQKNTITICWKIFTKMSVEIIMLSVLGQPCKTLTGLFFSSWEVAVCVKVLVIIVGIF